MVGLIDAALAYAERAWPVLPLRPKAKTPLTDHGLHDATTQANVVRGWWVQWPNANIGIRTGVRFDVLDIDGPEGLASLAAVLPADQLEDLGGVVCDPGEIFDGPIVATGKGWHVYVTTTGYGNRAGILPYVDWRGVNGYVVAPPSIHPAGAHYCWVSDDGPDRPLQPAPGWLLELLEPRIQPVIPVKPIRPSAPKFEETRYALAGLRAEAQAVAAAPEGNRNHTLNVAAYKMRRFVEAGHLHPDDVFDTLTGAAMAAGLTFLETQRTIRSGLGIGT